MLLITALSVSRFQAAEYIGSQACAQCHQSEFQKQSTSHHANALRPIAGSSLGAALLKAGHSPDGRLLYQEVQGNILVHEEGVSSPVRLEWAFGAGAQGSTPVGQFGDQFIEHRFSYYPRDSAFAPTFGHARQASTPVAELGILQDKRTISNCFNCHATGLQRSGSIFSLDSIQPGVQCERCHGPGSRHVQAAKLGQPKLDVQKEVVNPGRLPARAQIEICGQCHRLPTAETGNEPELEDPVTVRFAPIGLLASQCFRVSKAISCLTCHNPHTDANSRSDTAYSQKCLGCHASDHSKITLCRRIQRDNCLTCHMTQISLGPHLKFTDHRIRIN